MTSKHPEFAQEDFTDMTNLWIGKQQISLGDPPHITKLAGGIT